MPSLAGALTGLGLLGLPAIPSPSYFAELTVQDTWSLQLTEQQSSVSVVEQGAGTDTWSLGWNEGASAIASYPAELTQLEPLAVPGKFRAVTDKAFTSVLAVAASDSWLLLWQETPTDLVFLDIWDIWALKLTEAPVGLSVSQVFFATDTWPLNFLDVGSVFSGAPIEQNRTDSWSLQWNEAPSAVAVAQVAADTWSISVTDAGTVAVTQDAKSASDTWSLAFALESGFVNVLVEIPIIASDEWRLATIELGVVAPIAPLSGVKRVVLLRTPNRMVRPS